MLAVDKLRERFAKKVQRMDERIRRAETRVDREKSQYDQQKLQTGISMGATVLGALFGGRGMGRATSAARGAGRVAREREDVRRAEEEMRDLEEARRALGVDVEEEVRALQADLERDAPELEEVIVRPTKGGHSGLGPQARLEARVTFSNASRTSVGASTSSINTPSPLMGAASLPLGWMKQTRWPAAPGRTPPGVNRTP